MHFGRDFVFVSLFNSTFNAFKEKCMQFPKGDGLVCNLIFRHYSDWVYKHSTFLEHFYSLKPWFTQIAFLSFHKCQKKKSRNSQKKRKSKALCLWIQLYSLVFETELENYNNPSETFRAFFSFLIQIFHSTRYDNNYSSWMLNSIRSIQVIFTVLHKWLSNSC